MVCYNIYLVSHVSLLQDIAHTLAQYVNRCNIIISDRDIIIEH